MLVKKIRVYDLDENGEASRCSDVTLRNPIDVDEDDVKYKVEKELGGSSSRKKFVIIGDWAFLIGG